MFVPWHPFDHPTLGEVEIGGWRRNKVSPPEGELVQKECEMGNRFTIYLAGLAPRVSIADAEITDKEGGIYQLDLAVENKGFLPTATEQAQSLGSEPVLLSVEPNVNVEILYGQEKTKIGHILGFSKSEKTTFILRVKEPSAEALMKVHVTSQKAGRDSRVISIK